MSTVTSGWPANAIEAVTGIDPYPYYDDLATRPITWDEALRLWVAGRAADVEAVLGHPDARVRPAGAEVPPALAGTQAGDVFGGLVRMNDRGERAAVRDAVVAAVSGIGDPAVELAVRAAAGHVAATSTERDAAFVNRWITEVPIAAIAHLVGVRAADLAAAIRAAKDLGVCFGPTPPSDACAVAGRAVATLLRLATEAVATRPDGLAAALVGSLPRDRLDDALANTIGLLFQTVDAMAGLIGNVIARLAGSAAPGRVELAAAVTTVVRCDPAVHNTRRFFARAADVGGVTIGAGDTVLVVLAAANRSAGGDGVLSFGSGAHRCPAGELAPLVAELAVAALIETWPGVLDAVRTAGHRPMPNVRIPLFGVAQPAPGPFGNASS